MSNKINYYQIPDKFWFRIHFVRPRFKSNIENVLLYMANECCRIPRCSCSEYNKRYFNAIKMFPGNIGMTRKTLDNWRTEIPALFGFYKENKETDITETTQMAVFLHENQDLTQFLRLFLYLFQFPGGHMKAVDVKDIIYNNIKFKPARILIQVLLAGNSILSEQDSSKEMSISAEEATYCIFNDIRVTSGTQTLKDAVNETLREWTNRIDDTHYVIGSVMGPAPFPEIVRDFQSVIGKEIKSQLMEREGKLPDAVIACVGGGSNAMGAFYDFIPDESVQLIGCEAAGHGVNTDKNAATIANGTLGIFHGMKSYFCQDEYGQIAPVYSISAGLDYPGIGPEHAHLHDIGRARYVPVTDEEAVSAFEYLSRIEGIIPAIESSHALAYARKLAPTMNKDQIIVVNISGRGDKDVAAIARYRGVELYE